MLSFFSTPRCERHLVTPPNVRAVRIGALDILNRATVSSLQAERTIKNVLRAEKPQVAARFAVVFQSRRDDSRILSRQ